MMAPAMMIAQEISNPPGSVMTDGAIARLKCAAKTTTTPIRTPIGSTLRHFLSGTKVAAPTAPIAMPTDTTA